MSLLGLLINAEAYLSHKQQCRAWHIPQCTCGLEELQVRINQELQPTDTVEGTVVE